MKRMRRRCNLRGYQRTNWAVAGPEFWWGMIRCMLLLILQASASSILVLALESAIYGFFIGMIMTPVLTIIPDRVRSVFLLNLGPIEHNMKSCRP